jgi:hypothetical protein
MIKKLKNKFYPIRHETTNEIIGFRVINKVYDIESLNSFGVLFSSGSKQLHIISYSEALKMINENLWQNWDKRFKKFHKISKLRKKLKNET